MPDQKTYTAENIARVCHEANRGYQAAHPTTGIPVAAGWDDFPQDQRDGVIAGVQAALDDPERTPAESHEGWCEHKRKNGWVYGEEKDAEAKTHPCLLPYDELPAEQRVKDAIFLGIVRAMSAVED